ADRAFASAATRHANQGCRAGLLEAIDERAIELDHACRGVGPRGAVRSWKRSRRRRGFRRRRRQGRTNDFDTLLDELNARSLSGITHKRAGERLKLTAVQRERVQGNLNVELATGGHRVEWNVHHKGLRFAGRLIDPQAETRALAWRIWSMETSKVNIKLQAAVRNGLVRIRWASGLDTPVVAPTMEPKQNIHMSQRYDPTVGQGVPGIQLESNLRHHRL